MLGSGFASLCIVARIDIVAEDCEGLTLSTVDHPPHKRRMACRKDLIYGAVLQRKEAVRRHRPLTPRRPVSLRLWGGMVHGRYRKALAMLSDNAYHHHDAQQRQPVGFHTAPLVKVIFSIKI